MKKLLLWLPAIFWMFVIFGFSATPSLRVSSVNWQDFIIRKTAHFVEYFILYYLYLLPLKNNRRLALIFAVLYAITDELHQLLVIGREGRIRDVIIDGLGASLGWYTSRK